VYWNTVHLTSEYINLQSDTIKISGWRSWSHDNFNLCDDAKYADRNSGYANPFPFVSIRCSIPEFKTKLDTCDLTKKCFIKGKLDFTPAPLKGCKTHTIVVITNIDDIYFE
jgi:hypothetical protein